MASHHCLSPPPASAGMSRAWAESLVGRDWEIYWAQDSPAKHGNGGGSDSKMENPGMISSVSGAGSAVALAADASSSRSVAPQKADDAIQSMRLDTIDGDANDSVEDESGSDREPGYLDDWYVGRVLKVVDQKNNDAGARVVLRVHFVGEDEPWSMPLTPADVRPCVRAWVKRSVALLSGECMSVLPADTRQLSDAPELAALRDDIDDEFGRLRNHVMAKMNTGITNEDDHSSEGKSIQQVLSWYAFCQEQILLRTKLPKVVDPADDEPTEAYVSHLQSCIQELEAALQWYLNVQRIRLQQMNHCAGTGTTIKLTPQYVTERMWSFGWFALWTLSQMDYSVVGAADRKKRKALSPPGPLSTSVSPASAASCAVSQRSSTRNGPKRRKRSIDSNRGRDGSIAQADAGRDDIDGYDDDFDWADDTWDSSAAKRMARKLRCTPAPFGAELGNLMVCVSHDVMRPMLQWQATSDFYLGIRGRLDFDGAATGGSENEGDDQIMASFVGPDDERFVSCSDIEELIAQSSANAVLCHIDFDVKLALLREKLDNVVEFENNAWSKIASILDDDMSTFDHFEDAVLQTLKTLNMSSYSRSLGVWNVSPIGRASSKLTRKTIENAVLYREWYLDFRRAEELRERASFVDELVSRMSRLPCLPSCDALRGAGVEEKFTRLTPRVQQLSQQSIENLGDFGRYRAILMDRSRSDDEATQIKEIGGAHLALEALRQARVVSLAEEMLSIRVDVLEWAEAASAMLTNPRPSFVELDARWDELQAIIAGTSKYRISIIEHLAGDAEIDSNVREFAAADLDEFCSESYRNVVNLHAVASSWKDRADGILVTLQSHGNKDAGDAPSGIKPTAAMVDVKRIHDALNDYEHIKVNMDDKNSRLSRTYQASRSWAEEVGMRLLQNPIHLDNCLDEVRVLCARRPKGIIVAPTRQEMDSLRELLEWYSASRGVGQQTPAMRVHQLLYEGLDVLHYVADNSDLSGPRFNVDELSAVLSERENLPRVSRILSVDKLRASNVSAAVLNRLVESVPESPMLKTLLFCVWKIQAVSFVDNIGGQSLKAAEDLWNQRPVELESIGTVVCDSVDSLEKHIVAANVAEKSIRTALSSAKGLLRECLRRTQDVESHLASLKLLQHDYKERAALRHGLSLDAALENTLDADVKLFSWLNRALQFSVLRSEEGGWDGFHDNRISWDVLVKLYESIPDTQGFGDFAYVLLRTRELHAAASSWQAEVSNYTLLSLRGGRRRKPATTPKSDLQAEDETSLIDVDRVADLSDSPVLSKVAMPREDAIRTMLAKTRKFEMDLHEFLGRDYEEIGSDRASYPNGESLVGADGKFVLYRLTGSPMFRALKGSIMSIAEVADDVLADTPGKATFDWIRNAVAWLDDFDRAVVRGPAGSDGNVASKLVIPASEAKRLLAAGESVLLEVPDDLKKTLGQHKIFISTNKDGKLTVRSKKGGAHHAIGAATIRWCPILFDALRQDVADFDDWEAKLRSAHTCIVEASSSRTGYDDEAKLQIHRIRDDVADLVDGASKLIVCPLVAQFEACQLMLARLNEFLSSESSLEIERKYTELVFRAPQNVIGDRFRLLDSLVSRQKLLGDRTGAVEEAVGNGSHFRLAARVLFEKALHKGAEILRLHQEAGFSTFCSLKAREIEQALCDECQGELVESKVSQEYETKARALKRSLSTHATIEYCIRVLCGDLTPAQLVRKSLDELADPLTQKARVSAQQAARKGVMLTTDKPIAFAKPALQSRLEAEAPLAETPRLSPVGQLAGSNHPDSSPKSPRPITKFAQILNASKPALPPPAPPSLAATTLSSAGRTFEDDQNVSNSAGGASFMLSVANEIIRISLRAEGHVAEGIVLQEELTSKDRVSAENWAKFVMNKLAGDRYVTSKFRVLVFGDKEMKKYKKFYKHYEGKLDRMAVVNVGDGLKGYIVTPKFHRVCRELSFENAQSTYCVILTRNTDDFLD